MYKNFRFGLLMATSLFAVSANGEPMAYSVNSDSWDIDLIKDDSLYSIDLNNSSSDVRIGRLTLGAETRSDTEGLAFAPDGTLWGLDDESSTLFSIDTETGAVNFGDNTPLFGFPQSSLEQGNDFGMTFGCDGTLYATSVLANKLYKLNLDSGIGEPIGDLNADIIAIAAIGNPTRLFGLGDGQSPNLYNISVTTGAAIKIGGLSNARTYNEGGLAFDSDGNLWAITDRRGIGDQASEVLSIDVDTGIATVAGTTQEIGFESLAIGGPPAGCKIVDEYTAPIPTLNPAGRLLAIFVLMFAGMVFLRKRIS